MTDFSSILSTLTLFQDTITKHQNNEITNELKENYTKLIEESPKILAFLKNQLKAINSVLESKKSLQKGQKIDYYYTQTDKTVTVIFNIANMTKKTVSQDSDVYVLSPSFELDTGRTYTVDIFLLKKIEPKKTQINIKSDTVEFILEKSNEQMWETLEHIDSDSLTTDTGKLQYPSSAKRKNDFKNVDYIQKNIEDKSGIKGGLFYKSIYGTLDDKGKQAFEKSFTESNGTKIDMNWNNVFEKKEEDSDDGFNWNTNTKPKKGKLYHGEELEKLKKNIK